MSTALAAPAATTAAPALSAHNTALSIFATSDAFEQAQRAAKLLAASDLLPVQFRNNVPNCVVAMEMANRLGASPFAVFQNLYVVHGRPGWSSQFLIAMVNASGRFSPLQFRMEGQGDQRSCVAWAKEKATTEVIEGPPVTMAMAKAEGWSTKQGSKWLTMPEVMLRYRAASFFAKFYCPDITLGMQTAEEISDMPPEIRNVTRPESFSDALAGKVGGDEPSPAPATVVEPEVVKTPEPPKLKPRSKGASQQAVEQSQAKTPAPAPEPEEKPQPSTTEAFQCTIRQITVKSGQSAKGPWTAIYLGYQVEGEEPKIAVTFSDSLREQILNMKEGDRISLETKPGAQGKSDQIVSVALVESEAPDSNNSGPDEGGETQVEMGDGW